MSKVHVEKTADQADEKTVGDDWAYKMFERELRPELEENARERAAAIAASWIPRPVQKKS